MDLGARPDRLRLFLTPGAGFTSTLEIRGGTYAVGSTLSLKFDSGAEWTATRQSDTEMLFSIDHTQVDTITSGDGVRLNYNDNGAVETWAIGAVTLNG